MNTIIRKIRPEEYSLLREFLYQAIYLPGGVDPSPRSVVDLPELQVYIADFGTRPGDHCIVAEAAGKVVGAAWFCSRSMDICGHPSPCRKKIRPCASTSGRDSASWRKGERSI